MTVWVGQAQMQRWWARCRRSCHQRSPCIGSCLHRSSTDRSRSTRTRRSAHCLRTLGWQLQWWRLGRRCRKTRYWSWSRRPGSRHMSLCSTPIRRLSQRLQSRTQLGCWHRRRRSSPKDSRASCPSRSSRRRSQRAFESRCASA